MPLSGPRRGRVVALAECKYQAQTATVTIGASSHPKTFSDAIGEGIGEGIVQAMDEQELIKSGMRAKGFRQRSTLRGGPTGSVRRGSGSLRGRWPADIPDGAAAPEVRILPPPEPAASRIACNAPAQTGCRPLRATPGFLSADAGQWLPHQDRPSGEASAWEGMASAPPPGRVAPTARIRRSAR